MFAGKVPGRVEQDLDDTWLTQMAESSTAVIHQHCRWHQVTEAYISALRIRPIALLRNASDTVMSVRDHLKVRGGNWPFGFVDQEILARSDEDIDTFVVDHLMPWYFNFAVGWISSPFPVLTYEEVLTDQERGARTLLDSLGIAVDSELVARTIAGIESFRTRFNVGISGRGQALNGRAQRHLDRLAEHYSHIDLSPLGIKGLEMA